MSSYQFTHEGDWSRAGGSSLSQIFSNLRPGTILAVAIVVGFLIGLVGDQYGACHVGAPSGCASVTDLLAQNNDFIVVARTYWQFFTSIFVTDSPLDAAFNAIAVLVLDRFMSRVFNPTRYFTIFFLTALLGNLFSLLNGPNYASAGASGGIFGLFAAAFSYSWAEEKKIDLTTLTLFILIFVTSSFLISNVDYLAHFGGSIGGFIAGPLLYENLKDRIARFEPLEESSNVSRLLIGAFVIFLIVASASQFLIFIST